MVVVILMFQTFYTRLKTRPRSYKTRCDALDMRPDLHKSQDEAQISTAHPLPIRTPDAARPTVFTRCGGSTLANANAHAPSGRLCTDAKPTGGASHTARRHLTAISRPSHVHRTRRCAAPGGRHPTPHDALARRSACWQRGLRISQAERILERILESLRRGAGVGDVQGVRGAGQSPTSRLAPSPPLPIAPPPPSRPSPASIALPVAHL